MDEIAFKEYGAGRPFFLLHGGGGPLTVDAFAQRLAAEHSVRVLVPTHPGFGGTPRPESLTTVRQLAALYIQLLDELDLSDVTVIGNSMGGWIAAEMGLLHSPRIGRVVIVDGVGIEVPDHPIADFYSLTPRQLAELSYHDPDRYGIDPTKLPPAALQAMAGNRVALGVYAGTSMLDPTLAERLSAVRVPTLVVWGDADRIADAVYGRAFAAAIPGAKFELLSETGHLPQIESPAALLDVIRNFAAA